MTIGEFNFGDEIAVFIGLEFAQLLLYATGGNEVDRACCIRRHIEAFDSYSIERIAAVLTGDQIRVAATGFGRGDHLTFGAGEIEWNFNIQFSLFIFNQVGVRQCTHYTRNGLLANFIASGAKINVGDLKSVSKNNETDSYSKPGNERFFE